jgi:hypothetical protein
MRPRSIEKDKDYLLLRHSHQQFILGVMSGKTYTDAYLAAFPNATKKTAGTKGSEMRTKYLHIIERNSPINPDTLHDVANETLHNLSQMAFADLGKMVDADGIPLPLHKIPLEIRIAITEVEVEGKRISYKVGGKIKALEALSRIAGLHKEEPQVQVNLLPQEERDKQIKEIIVRAMARGSEEGSE